MNNRITPPLSLFLLFPLHAVLNRQCLCSNSVQPAVPLRTCPPLDRRSCRFLHQNASASTSMSRGEAAIVMDVLLMICHHQITIFSDAEEPSTMFKLKRNIQGIFEQLPDEQQLRKANQFLVACKMLGECGFTSQRAWPQAPATVGLAFWADDAFGALHVEPFSSPPELPDVMKPQDSGSSANEQAVQ